MLLPASPEFISLCQEQIALLTQGLGASLCAVYLTQEWAEGTQPRLLPIATYPDNGSGLTQRGLPLSSSARPMFPSLPQSVTNVETNQPEGIPDVLLPSWEKKVTADAINSVVPDKLLPQRQVVLPLIHEETVLGLLVVERSDRAWNGWEASQIEQVANTLAIACVLDQRYQWLHHEQQQRQLLERQYHDTVDNLLHQFRNSLTALRTFGKLIFKRLQAEDSNRSIADSIVRETTRLQELSQQMEQATGASQDPLPSLALPPAIEASKSDAQTEDATTQDSTGLARFPRGQALLGQSEFALERCSVATVLTPLLASAQTIAETRGLTIHSHVSDELPLVWANPQALREVFNNIMENALKYTPGGGQISISGWVSSAAEDAAAQVAIAITDTGSGIPSQDLPHLFERHFRGVQAEGDIPGTGLGLAIARTLVEQMNGAIQVFSPAWADSIPISTATPGTTFVVWLWVAESEV